MKRLWTKLAEVEHLVTLGCDRDKATAALLKCNSVDEALSACIEEKPARLDAVEADPSPEVEMTSTMFKSEASV